MTFASFPLPLSPSINSINIAFVPLSVSFDLSTKTYQPFAKPQQTINKTPRPRQVIHRASSIARELGRPFSMFKHRYYIRKAFLSLPVPANAILSQPAGLARGHHYLRPQRYATAINEKGRRSVRKRDSRTLSSISKPSIIASLLVPQSKHCSL